MEYEINAYSSEEEIDRRPKTFRRRPNYFEELDNTDFFTKFRLSKATVQRILEDIDDNISCPTTRNEYLASENQLLALRYYATGSFLSVAGDFIGISKTTASKTVRRVSVALANLRPNYIKMLATCEAILESRQQFFNLAGFPRCIGALDCSHVKIQSPGGEDAELYRNRKGFFFLSMCRLCLMPIQKYKI